MDKEEVIIKLKVHYWKLICEHFLCVFTSSSTWIFIFLTIIFTGIMLASIFNLFPDWPVVIKSILFIIVFILFIVSNTSIFLFLLLEILIALGVILFPNRGTIKLNNEGIFINCLNERGFISWDIFKEISVISFSHSKCLRISLNDYDSYLKTSNKCDKPIFMSDFFIKFIKNPLNKLLKITDENIYLPIYWFKNHQAIVDLINDYSDKD